MESPPHKVVELRIPSELGNEKMAIVLAAEVAARMGFAGDRIEDLKTAVGEACLNAIEHGNRLDANMKVLVTLTMEPTRLAVNVHDCGASPIPAERQLPDVGRMLAGTLPSGGFGICLIKSLMDEVNVSREPGGGNQLRMVIYMKKQSCGEGGA